jgi:hypothetical protein
VNGLFPPLPRFQTRLDKGVYNLPGAPVLFGQMRKLFQGHGFPVTADSESGQALFQIARAPDSYVVIAAFQDMPEVENNGFKL